MLDGIIMRKNRGVTWRFAPLSLHFLTVEMASPAMVLMVLLPCLPAVMGKRYLYTNYKPN